MQDTQYGTVIPSHTLLYCLTNFLPDRCSTWTGHPRGQFPTSPGITGLRISRPAGRCALTGRSRSADIAQTGLSPTPRNHPTTLDIRLPDIPEPLSLCTFTHNRVLTNMSGLSPYCCSTCPGFHRAAVLFLSELCTNKDPHGSP